MHKVRTTLTAAAVGALLWAQLAPHPGGPGTLPDGFVHFLLYTGFVLGTWLLGPRTWGDPQERLQAVTRLALLLGIVLEVLQEALPTRDFDVRDLAMNLLGSMVGYGVGVVVVDWGKQGDGPVQTRQHRQA